MLKQLDVYSIVSASGEVKDQLALVKISEERVSELLGVEDSVLRSLSEDNGNEFLIDVLKMMDLNADPSKDNRVKAPQKLAEGDLASFAEVHANDDGADYQWDRCNRGHPECWSAHKFA